MVVVKQFVPGFSFVRGKGGSLVPADKAAMISSDKPNMGEGLLMKRHGPQISGLEPGIKQRDQLIVQSSEN
jgi:hypothetical protein